MTFYFIFNKLWKFFNWQNKTNKKEQSFQLKMKFLNTNPILALVTTTTLLATVTLAQFAGKKSLLLTRPVFNTRK